MNRKTEVLSLLSVSLVAWAGAASAIGIYPIDAGREWRATTDEALFNAWTGGSFSPRDGRAAFVPYGNDGTPGLNGEDVMWYCTDPFAVCRDRAKTGTGPNEVFFAREIFVKRGDPDIGSEDIMGSFSILADDYVEFYVADRGMVFNALLDRAFRPLRFEIISGGAYLESDQGLLGQYGAADIFRHGSNLLVIRAMDGQLIGGDFTAADCTDDKLGGTIVPVPQGSGDDLPFCRYDRLNEYVYLSGSIRTVAEPGSLALLGLGLAGLGFTRRRGLGSAQPWS